MIELMTRFDALDDEKAERFAQRLAVVQEEVRAEPGFVSYAVYRTQGQPTALFVLEGWSTQEDADRHVQLSTEGQAAREALALLAAPPATLTLTRQN